MGTILSDPTYRVNEIPLATSTTDRKFTYAAVFFSALVLAGCATDPATTTAPSSTMDRGTRSAELELSGDIQDLLARASRSVPPASIELTLTAAEQALAAGEVRQAAAILEQANTSGFPELQRRATFLAAEVSLGEGDPVRALEILESPSVLTGALTRDDQVRIGVIRAQAYYNGRSYLASARERIFIHNLLEESEKNLNHEQIFSALMESPAETLFNQAERAITSDLRGWLSLAAVSKQSQDDPLEQLVALNRWKKAWSFHPAATRLPAILQLLSRIVEERPRAIALLLPLQGDLGPYGRAIRDGLLAAHFAAENQPTIRVYDSTSGSMAELLRTAKADGAELVIGPLDRERVTEVTEMRSVPLPVLALNRSLGGSVDADVYQFGLSPEDEVLQVANQVSLEGKRNALVLYPASDWGERTYQTFQAAWLERGGNVVDAAAFANERDYSDLVKALLNVDESEARAAELRRITGQRYEFTPRRRQDIDFVFLLANPSQARRLNPTLAFFYADDIPVYATSHVHEYVDSRIDAIDLNGIRFCDIPWKLTSSDRLQQQIQSTWPASRAALAPFFALGVDAYRLYPRLQQLKELPDARVFGTTGVLKLNEANVINRELMWARFINGTPVAAPLIMEVGNR